MDSAAMRVVAPKTRNPSTLLIRPTHERMGGEVSDSLSAVLVAVAMLGPRVPVRKTAP